MAAEGLGRAPATDASAALVLQLIRRGVRHLVLSPGSRSQALAVVAAECERSGLLSLHVRIDERVAGFTALGLARESGTPAVLVCTSGTATANFLPVVMEADHSGVPLIVLTADRPPELHGVGANQTTRQAGVYGTHVREAVDLPVPDQTDPTGDGPLTLRMRAVADAAVDAAWGVSGAARGPVHLNMPLREPLSGALPAWLNADAAAPDHHPDRTADDRPYKQPVEIAPGPRTIVVAGADAGPIAEEVSYNGGWPLVAEIVSGARYGRYVVRSHRALLADPELGGRVQRAVVFGHPTLSREVSALLSRPEVEVIAVDGPGERLNLNGATRAVPAVTTTGRDDRAWLGAWMRASRAAAVDVAPPAPDADGLSSAVPKERLSALAAEVEVFRAPVDRPALVDAVWRASWPHDRLVFGSSRLVRVADDVLGGKKVPVHANRGLAGIDGTVATALGVAVASQIDGSLGVTRVLLGDLAMLHDVGALLWPPDEPSPRIQVIVGADGGGTIFDGLEVARTTDASTMRRVMYTPHTADLSALAAAYGWEYRRVTTRSELDQVLTAPSGGRQLIEVPLER